DACAGAQGRRHRGAAPARLTPRGWCRSRHHPRPSSPAASLPRGRSMSTTTTSRRAARPVPPPETDASRPPRRRSGGRALLQRREARIALLFVLPAFLLFLAFRFGPAIAGVGLSLFDYDISGEI